MLFQARVPVCCNENRADLYQQLVAAGAHCHKRTGEEFAMCVVCAPSATHGSLECQSTFNTIVRKQGPYIYGANITLYLASRSTFCIEPLSDTLVRTHFYVAVLAGCIPVIFDNIAAATPTRWAWRQPLPRTALDGRLDGVLGAETPPAIAHQRAGWASITEQIEPRSPTSAASPLRMMASTSIYGAGSIAVAEH